MADDFQYVKLPDGSLGKFSTSATDDVIKSQILKDFPDAYGKVPSAPKVATPTPPQAGPPVSRFDQIVADVLNPTDLSGYIGIGNALSGFQHYVNDPLDAIAKKAGQIGSEILTTPSGQSADMFRLARYGQQPRPMTPEEKGRASAVGETIGSTLGDVRNLPLMLEGGPILKKAMGAGFATLMGSNVVQQAGETGKVWDDNSPEGREARSKGLTSMVLGTGMAGLAGSGVRETPKMEGIGPKVEAPPTDVETGKIQPEEMAPKPEPKAPGKPSFDTQVIEPKKMGDSTMHRMSIMRDGEEVGHISGIVDPTDPSTLQIHDSELTAAERGNGLGKQAYEEFINHAKDSGFSTLRSDSIVSPAAGRVWESLGKKGYDVQQVMEGLSGKQYELNLKPKDASSPFTNDDVFSYQDSHAERVIHSGWEWGNPLRHILEGAGDLLRETSKYSGPKDISKGYLKEKVKRIERHLENGFLAGDLPSVEHPKTAAKVNELIEAYKDQPVVTKAQQLARDLTVALAKRDTATATSLLTAFKKEAGLTEDIRPAQDVPVDLGAAAKEAYTTKTSKFGTTMHEVTLHDSKGDVKGRLVLKENKDTLEVDDSFLDEELRGKGLGKQLYQAGKSYAKEKGFRFFGSHPSEVSDSAANVWKRLGASQEGVQYKIPLQERTPEQHASDLLTSLKAKETIFPERLTEVEKATGVKLAGKEPNVQAHALKNFQQSQVTLRALESALTEKDPALSNHLPAIKDAIAKRFPDADASQRTGNYLSALSYLRKHIGDADRVEKAMDIAVRKSEQGSLPGHRYDEAALKAIAQDHVGKILERYEPMGDARLGSEQVFGRLTSPQFERAVADAKSPELTKRWEALKVRSAPPNLPDPAEALFMDVQGQVLTSGKVTEGIMRDYTGNLARDKEQLYNSLEKSISEWDSRSIADFGDFTDKMEHGDFANMSPRDQATAKTLRGLLDDRREKLQGLGTGKLETFIENYFPHLWVANKNAAKYFSNLLMAKRSLQGGSGFLKPREYDYLIDGLKAGLEPVTYNPIRMALLRIHEIDKFLMAHQIKANLQVQGLVRWFKEGQAPVGWVKLDDRIFKPSVSETRTNLLGEEVPTGGHTSYGQYYAPKDGARVINNYLSPGLGANSVYRAVRLYNNLVNSVNLGMSAFHGFEVSFNAAATDLALAIDKVLYPATRFKDMGNGTAVTVKGRDWTGATMAAGRAFSGASVFDHYFQGSHLLAEYMEPGQYKEMSRLAEALSSAGGRVGIDPIYRNNFAEQYRNARKQLVSAEGMNKLVPAAKMAWRVQGLIIEKLSAPLMEHFVPRMKLGAFARMAQDALERMGPDAPESMIRNELGKIWDSVDNRHGQMVYDNIFIHKIAKDMAAVGFRSMGWTGGTVRELGGSFILGKDSSTGKLQLGGDLRNMVQQKLKGQNVDISRRLSYAIALPVMAAYVGGIIHYLHTGQAPQTVKDLFYPQDGKGNRIWFKNYMGDVINFARHPADTTLRKAAPWLSQAYELYKNQDYYGQEVFSNDNPETVLDKTIFDGTIAERVIDPQSWKEAGKYLGRSSQPFSVTNYQQRRATGATIPEALESAAGILPAPKWVSQSAAEAYVSEQVLRKMSVGPKTAQEAEHMKTMRNLRDALTNGRMTEKDVYSMADQGKISMDDADNLSDELDSQQTTPLERGFKQLPAHVALRAYELATPEERSKLEDMLVDKFESDNYEEKYKPEEVQQLDTRYMKALNLPVHDPEVKNNLKPATR